MFCDTFETIKRTIYAFFHPVPHMNEMLENSPPSPYAVYTDSGEYLYRLNENLARKQNITESELDALIVSHKLRHYIFQLSERHVSNASTQRMLAKVFEELEYEQQALWGFAKDNKYHCFYDFPGCSCPKMDNSERLGHSSKVHNALCPIHGFKVEENDDNTPIEKITES